MAAQDKLNQRQIKRLPELFKTETNTIMARQKVDGSETQMRESQRSGISSLWRTRNKVRLPQCHRGRTVFNIKVWNTGSVNGDRPNRYKRDYAPGNLRFADHRTNCVNQRRSVLSKFEQKYWPYVRNVVVRKLSQGLTRDEIIQDAEKAVFEKRKNWKLIDARLDFMIYEMPEDIIVLPYRENSSTTAVTEAQGEP